MIRFLRRSSFFQFTKKRELREKLKFKPKPKSSETNNTDPDNKVIIEPKIETLEEKVRNIESSKSLSLIPIHNSQIKKSF
jgi:hypothetical protein